MTVIPLNTTSVESFRLDQSFRWRDPDIDCTLVISQPSTDPDLWHEYTLGAARSYRKFGVECALDADALRTGADTALFFAVLDRSGKMVAGTRAIGPLRYADESHAVAEWDGQPGQQAVRDMIEARIPFGVLELKAAWVIDDPDRNRVVATALARSASHFTAVLDVQFCMATAAAHVLNRWRSSGSVVTTSIPAAPYPDERYQTKMMWWDRRDFVNHAEPEQVVKILKETALLHKEFDDRYGTEALRFGGA